MLVGDPGTAGGYYWLSLVTMMWYLAAMFIVIYKHIQEQSVSMSTSIKYYAVAHAVMLSSLCVFGVAFLERAIPGLRVIIGG